MFCGFPKLQYISEIKMVKKELLADSVFSLIFIVEQNCYQNHCHKVFSDYHKCTFPFEISKMLPLTALLAPPDSKLLDHKTFPPKVIEYVFRCFKKFWPITELVKRNEIFSRPCKEKLHNVHNILIFFFFYQICEKCSCLN